eukprot:1139398-Pelagomonas_calceolata.AAC.1
MRAVQAAAGALWSNARAVLFGSQAAAGALWPSARAVLLGSQAAAGALWPSARAVLFGSQAEANALFAGTRCPFEVLVCVCTDELMCAVQVPGVSVLSKSQLYAQEEGMHKEMHRGMHERHPQEEGKERERRGAAECGLAGTQIESLSGCGAECELQACGLNLPGSDLDVVLLNVLDDVETPMVSTDS